jgi:hypothetical protein
LEIAPPFYRTGANRPSATPAVAADRAVMTSTIRHRFSLLLHGATDLLQVEPDDPADLNRRYLSFSIGSINGIGTDTQLMS